MPGWLVAISIRHLHLVLGVGQHGERIAGLAPADWRARGFHLRQMTKYLIGDGEIVRQQNPEGVDVLMRIRPAEPIASDGEDLAELPRSRRVRQGFDAGMVAPFVHHEDAFPRPLDQTARGGNVAGHRLLDEDRLSRGKQLLDHRGMARRRRRHHVAVNVLGKRGNVGGDADRAAIERVLSRRFGRSGHADPGV